jgi:cell division protein FtsA
VYVGIAGHHIKSLQTRGDIVRHDTENEISQREIDQLIADQYKTYIPAGDQIIDVIPQEYTVDNFQNISDPIGYGGVKVGANFHIITGDKNAIRNINRSVEKSGLITKDLVLQPLGFFCCCNGAGRFGSRCGYCRYWWRYYRPCCFL